MRPLFSDDINSFNDIRKKFWKHGRPISSVLRCTIGGVIAGSIESLNIVEVSEEFKRSKELHYKTCIITVLLLRAQERAITEEKDNNSSITWGTRERERVCCFYIGRDPRRESGKALNEWIVRLAKCCLKSVREPMFGQVGGKFDRYYIIITSQIEPTVYEIVKLTHCYYSLFHQLRIHPYTKLSDYGLWSYLLLIYIYYHLQLK